MIYSPDCDDSGYYSVIPVRSGGGSNGLFLVPEYYCSLALANCNELAAC